MIGENQRICCQGCGKIGKFLSKNYKALYTSKIILLIRGNVNRGRIKYLKILGGDKNGKKI